MTKEEVELILLIKILQNNLQSFLFCLLYIYIAHNVQEGWE